MGVVYNFVLDQMFAAQKGGGATMNGKPIHVSQCNGKSYIQEEHCLQGVLLTSHILMILSEPIFMVQIFVSL